MSARLKFDPFEIRPFKGFINTQTGSHDVFNSIAQFFYGEVLSDSEPSYRDYILRLDNYDLLKLEIEAIGLSQLNISPQVRSRASELMYAGIYMQAVADRHYYASLVKPGTTLDILSCSIADELAMPLEKFLSNLTGKTKMLRAAVFGSAEPAYVQGCLDRVFSKTKPNCLTAINDQQLVKTISEQARRLRSALNVVEICEDVIATAQSLKARNTHFIYFEGDGVSPWIAHVIDALEESGAEVRRIPQEVFVPN